MPRTPKFNTQQKLKNLNENDDVNDNDCNV